MEAELFGHEKGAFTGADRMRKGKFEAAQGGTLLPDEIGDIPRSFQAKLLRVIETKKIQRIGGNKNIQVDFRLIAATNNNLAEEVSAGRFREYLYYRLCVIHIQIPPLRGAPGRYRENDPAFPGPFQLGNEKKSRNQG